MRKVTVMTAVLVVVVGLAVRPASAARPDFSSCVEAGDAFGSCVAGIAQAFQSGDEHTAPTDGINALVESCSTFAGEQLGACMAAAAQGLHDRGDPPGAAVSDAAHSLVDGCRGQVGRDFGACVSAAAHGLGHGGATRHSAEDETGDGGGEATDHEGHSPAHHGQPVSNEKPTHGQKPAKPGGH